MEPIERLLVGHWVTSFDVAFPNESALSRLFGCPRFIPTTILACFRFRADGTFELDQRRNKGGKVDPPRSRSGDYTIKWQSSGVAGGEIHIPGEKKIILHFYLESQDEMHWMMASVEPPAPVAQGEMHRVNLLAPTIIGDVGEFAPQP